MTKSKILLHIGWQDTSYYITLNINWQCLVMLNTNLATLL